MPETVDSHRFLGGLTSRLVKTWIKKEPPREIPWTPPARPLAETTVALVSSAAIALSGDTPFDQAGERANPWWGDPSFRTIPRGTTSADTAIYHLHIVDEYAAQDLNVLFPLDRLDELAGAGVVGAAAAHHFSFMGYLLQPEQFLAESVPAMISRMRADRVGMVALFPA